MTSAVYSAPRSQRLTIKNLALFALAVLPWMLIFSKLGIEICCAIIGLSFLYHCHRTAQWQWTREPFLRVCLIAWVWVTIVGIPLAIDPFTSLSDALFWIRFPLLYAACRYWLLQENTGRHVLAISLLTMIGAIALDAFWQYQTGMSLSGKARMDNLRLTGPFRSPKVGYVIGKFFFPVLILTLTCLVLPAKRYWALLPILLGLATLVITGDISATVSTGVAIGVAVLVMMVKLPRLRLPGLALLLAGLVGAMALIHQSPWLQARMERAESVLSDYRNSDYGAIAYRAADIAREHAWHGVGLDNFRLVAKNIAYGNEGGGTLGALHPHNYYLEWWVEAGVPGLMLFIVMVGLLLREALQRFRQAQGWEVLYPAAAIGLLTQHYFPLWGMQSYFTNWPALVHWLTLAVVYSLMANPKPRDYSI